MQKAIVTVFIDRAALASQPHVLVDLSVAVGQVIGPSRFDLELDRLCRLIQRALLVLNRRLHPLVVAGIVSGRRLHWLAVLDNRSCERARLRRVRVGLL